MADRAIAQAPDLFIMMHEHGVRAAGVNFLSKTMRETFHHLDERNMIMAEDDEVDKKMDTQHDDQPFEDANGVS